MRLERALRPATPIEALPIARLSRDRIEAGLGWSWTAPRVLRSIRDAQTNVVVATDTARLLGFGIMKYDDDTAHLLLLAVQPDASRQGVGTALIDWLEASARVAGIDRVELEARADNLAARGFYRRLGYLETHTVAGYYAGVEACVRLSKRLAGA